MTLMLLFLQFDISVRQCFVFVYALYNRYIMFYTDFLFTGIINFIWSRHSHTYTPKHLNMLAWHSWYKWKKMKYYHSLNTSKKEYLEQWEPWKIWFFFLSFPMIKRMINEEIKRKIRKSNFSDFLWRL